MNQDLLTLLTQLIREAIENALKGKPLLGPAQVASLVAAVLPVVLRIIIDQLNALLFGEPTPQTPEGIAARQERRLNDIRAAIALAVQREVTGHA